MVCFKKCLQIITGKVFATIKCEKLLSKSNTINHHFCQIFFGIIKISQLNSFIQFLFSMNNKSSYFFNIKTKA